MITVKQYKEICDQIVDAIEIDGHVLASSEEQSMKKLKDKDGIRLVAVYPSYHFDGSTDAYKDMHEILFFMVTRQIEGADDETELKQYNDSQEALIRLKEYLFGEDNNYCRLFPYLDISSVLIDPEYNIFGGYIGWSMKFVC